MGLFGGTAILTPSDAGSGSLSTEGFNSARVYGEDEGSPGPASTSRKRAAEEKDKLMHRSRQRRHGTLGPFFKSYREI